MTSQGKMMRYNARTESCTFPMAQLEKFKAAISMPWNDQGLYSENQVLRDACYISYSCLSDLYSKKLGLLAWEFRLHSLRAGGVTTAANSKITDWLFKKMEI